MTEDELKYQTAKADAEKLNLSSDWKVSDGLAGSVKIAHKCGIYVVGNRNGGYAVIKGDVAIANSMPMKSAISFIEQIIKPVEPEAKKVTEEIIKKPITSGLRISNTERIEFIKSKTKSTPKPAGKKAAKKTKGKK